MTESIVYNPWPLPINPEHQRPELNNLKAFGYEFDDAREVVDIFEKKVAKFAGAKYGIAIDCCTHAMELCFRYLFEIREIKSNAIPIPDNTYISVYWMLKQLGMKPVLVEKEWKGFYELGGTRVIDAAVRWDEDMYVVPGSFHCVSFQIKKPIPIGRGGMILTDDKSAAEWLRLARYDGRDMSIPYDEPGHIKQIGYHYYMTPEDAARGILLMDEINFRGDSGSWKNYPSISKMVKGI